MKTDNVTLVAALRILANDIQSQDGIANACIAEAADRIDELAAEKKSDAIKWLLLSNLSHGWKYSTNIRPEAADAALEWANAKGFADGVRLTNAGRVALVTGIYETAVDS